MFFLHPRKVKFSFKDRESCILELDMVTPGNDPEVFWQDGHSTWQIANTLLATPACVFYSQGVDMVCKTLLMTAISARRKEQVWR